MAKSSVQTTVRIDPETYEGGQEAARRAGLSLNSWIERSMRAALEREGITRTPNGVQIREPVPTP